MMALYQSFEEGQSSELIGIFEKESDIPEYLRDPNPTEEEIDEFIENQRKRHHEHFSREEAIELLTPRYYSVGEYPDYDNENDEEFPKPIYEGYLYAQEISVNPEVGEILRYISW